MSSRSEIEASLRAFSVVSYIFQREVATDLSLHHTDLHALHAIERAGGLTAGSLAVELGLTTGATTTVIDRLERRGWVARKPDPSDRRRVLVDLREENLAPLRRKYQEVNRRVRRLLATRSESDLDVIARFLRELTGAEERSLPDDTQGG